MKTALYRKYRSKSLSEIVGQNHITDILSSAISKGKISHAYLLTGPRGVGKTSIARILAHEINGLDYDESANHLDIIEIDAASNNGVEDARDLRDKVQIAPSSAKFKVYIIDEVHMLTKQAFNALLKTLEEPPEHIVFILATTDIEKLPATIISRVQRFTFRSISIADAKKHLAEIAKLEKIKIDDAALDLIAKHGQGSFRDSIGLLDQLSSLPGKNKISTDDVENTLGLSDSQTVEQLFDAYDNGDLATIAKLLKAAESSGTSASILSQQLLGFIQSTVVGRPDRIDLADGLMDVSRSNFPYIKLLVVLAPKNTTQNTVAAPREKTIAVKPAKIVTDKVTETKPAETAPPEATVDKPAKKSKKTNSSSAKLDWEQLVADAVDESVALRDLIKKSTPVEDDEYLKLYVGNKFHKLKLDNNSKRLHALLQKQDYDKTVEIIGTPPPATDSQAAAVIAMMGGGEQVNV